MGRRVAVVLSALVVVSWAAFVAYTVIAAARLESVERSGRPRRANSGGRGRGRPSGREVRVMAKKQRRRRSRAVLVRRYAAVGALMLVGLLYYRPLKAYLDAHSQLSQRRAAVQQLELRKTRLEHTLGSSTSVGTLAREARALGYVKPGEHLFIVKGINAWRKRERASMMAHRGR